MSIIRKLLHFLDQVAATGYIFWDTSTFTTITTFDKTIDLLCGDGSDGAVVFDGTTTYSFATLVGSTYTLTDHVTATSITISNNITIDPDSYMLRSTGDIVIGNNVTIKSEGNNGTSTAAGIARTASYYGGSGGGGAGRPYGTAAGNGTAGSATSGIRLGGAGGAGGNSTNTGGAAGGGTAWSTANGDKFIQSLLGWFINGTALAKIGGGSGGGGGAKPSGTQDTVASGGGGSGGGVIIIVAGGTITYGTGCSISVKGGNGGDATRTGSASGGGGGSGGGGFILLRSLYRSTVGPTLNVNAGTAGLGIGTGSNGAAGSSGQYIEIYDSLI